MSRVQPCPKCFRLISLPAESDTSVWVRCPLCGEEYRLQEALDFQPPSLELIPEPVASIPITSAAGHDHEEIAEQSIDDIAEPNRAVLEGIPFDPDLPAEPAELDSAAKSHEPAMMHADEDPLEAMLDEALYDESGKSPEAKLAHMPADGTSDEGASHDESGLIEDMIEDRSDIEPWDMPAKEHAAEVDEGQAIDLHDEQAAELHSEQAEIEPSEEPLHWQDEPAIADAEPQQRVHAFVPPEEPAGKKPKKKKSLGGELVKIVGGGVIGLLVAYAILLWGLKVDLLGVAKFLPASILPEQLRPKNLAARPIPQPQVAQNDQPDIGTTPDAGVPTTGTTPDTSTVPADGTPTPDATATTPPPGGLSDTLPMPGRTNPPDAPLTQPTPTSGDVATPPISVPPPETTANNPLPGVMPTPTGNPTPDTTATAPATSTPDPFAPPSTPDTFPPLPTTVTPPAPEPVGPKNTKNVSLAEASQAMAAATQATDAYLRSTADSPDLKTVRKNFYFNLAKLAEAITGLKQQPGDDHDVTMRATASGLISQLVGDRSRLDELGFLAGFWFDHPNRLQENIDGIALAGTVQEVQPLGKNFRTVVKLFKGNFPNAKDMAVTVISAMKPEVSAGDTAIVLGTIVKDPAQNLYGYDGREDRIVWAAVVTKAQSTPVFP